MSQWDSKKGYHIRKKSDHKVELYNSYLSQNKNPTALMIIEEVSRGKEVDREIKWE